MSEQPFFRFYPGAYSEGGPFERSDEICGVCQRPAGWLFIGVIYKAGEDDPIVCARCVADGSLDRVAPGYVLHDMDFSDAPDAELAREVEQRTPGFATWNAFVWPVQDGKPLAFMGYGSDVPEAKAAVAALFEEYDLENSDPANALVFKPLDGGGVVAVLDLD